MRRRFEGRALLRGFCVWTIFVWGVLIKNMLEDGTHSFAFRAIHIVLAIISIMFALSVWPLAKRLDREPARREKVRVER